MQLVDLTSSEEQARKDAETKWQNGEPERQKDSIREFRNTLLQEADIEIFKLEDSGGSTTAWRTYRQQLRDMTAQSDLANPTWPTKPSE